MIRDILILKIVPEVKNLVKQLLPYFLVKLKLIRLYLLKKLEKISDIQKHLKIYIQYEKAE